MCFINRRDRFLGAHILEQLLILPNIRIYCLARSQHGESVEQRVMEKMKFYFDETTLEQMKHRVQVIEGDLSEKHVGLTTEMQQTLLHHIDTIIHCGEMFGIMEIETIFKR